VVIKNDTVAPFDAPSLRSDIAVGITPQEQRGRGIPNSVAQNIEAKLSFAKYLLYNVLGTNACIIPAKKKPNNKKGDMALISSNIVIIILYF
jgi:hypothetical protein